MLVNIHAAAFSILPFAAGNHNSMPFRRSCIIAKLSLQLRPSLGRRERGFGYDAQPPVSEHTGKLGGVHCIWVISRQDEAERTFKYTVVGLVKQVLVFGILYAAEDDIDVDLHGPNRNALIVVGTTESVQSI